MPRPLLPSKKSSSSSFSSFLAPGEPLHRGRGRAAGWVGVLEPSLAASWDLTDPVVADLDLGVLAAALPPPETSVEPPPRFPGSEVDLTVTHPLSTAWTALEAAVRAGAPAELVAVEAKGRYRGPGVQRRIREDDADPAVRLAAALARARGRERVARRGGPAPSGAAGRRGGRRARGKLRRTT